MTTLRVYGDSFAAPAFTGTQRIPAGWATMLSLLLELPLSNKAVHGSSTEYSFQIFAEDVINNCIGDTDIIIFVVSSLGRLYFQHQQKTAPSTASVYLSDPAKKNIAKWYLDNKSHIEWWRYNNDRDLQGLTFESYVQFLKMFALSKPDTVVIVLPGFEYGYADDFFKNTCPTNFMKGKTTLMNISKNEAGMADYNFFDYAYFSKFTLEDPRVNHLTNANLHTLAFLLAEAIKNLSIDNLTYDKFQKNNIGQIKNKDEYLNYVENNIISYKSYILANLS
jgi:hypothetical protein